MKMKPEYKLAKRLPGVSQMERVRAARAMLDTRAGTEATKLHAFMAIFHPTYPEEKVRELVRDLKSQ
jgi:hypothetical protein